MTTIAEMTQEEVNATLEQIHRVADDLLTLQGTDDPDDAFAGALQFLIKFANVTDVYPSIHGIHPKIVLEVLVWKFGIEKVRDWARDISRRTAKAARRNAD